MSGYNWKTIFQSKDEKELLRIYSGESNLNFEAEIYAGAELKNRNFDFNKIIEIHKRKTEELRNEIKDFENLNFRSSMYFRRLIKFGIGFIVTFALLIMNHKQVVGERSSVIYLWVFWCCLFLFPALTAKWNYERFMKEKKTKINEKTELLNIITMPNTR